MIRSCLTPNPSKYNAELTAELATITSGSVVLGALEVPGHGSLPCMLIRDPKATCIVTYPPLHEQHRTIEDITPFVALTEDT